jgi:hypothetical protein
MSNARKHIAGIAARVRPFVRLADRRCMSAMTRNSNVQLETGLTRKARL